nr:T9SS type A sorting domain-containing protein [Ferruginibacter sp.]
SYDGANFITMGTQAAIGFGSNKYQFIDNQPTANIGGNVFYRLKIIDASNSFSYSPVFSGNCNDATMPMQIYPNPAQQYTNIKIAVRQKQQAQLLVYNVAGQLVFTADYTLQTGTNNFTIPLTNLASGTYAVKMTLNSGQKLNGSFVKN